MLLVHFHSFVIKTHTHIQMDGWLMVAIFNLQYFNGTNTKGLLPGDKKIMFFVFFEADTQ